jgi:hypothetical protein
LLVAEVAGRNVPEQRIRGASSRRTPYNGQYIGWYRIKAMLKKLFLKFGSGEASLPLEFEPGHVTILVGPNNSGKSLFLREIEAFTRLDDAAITKLLMGEGTDLKIIEWIELDLPAEDEVERSLLFRDVGVDAEWGRASPGYIHVGKLDLVYDRRLSRTGLSVRAVHPQKVVSSTVSARISEHERKRNPGMWGDRLS